MTFRFQTLSFAFTVLMVVSPAAAQGRAPLRPAPERTPTQNPVFPGERQAVMVVPARPEAFPDAPYSFAKPGSPDRLPKELLRDPYFLGFAAGVLRPPYGERLDPRLARRILRRPAAGESEHFTYGYVMFEGRITEAKMRAVRALGVEPLRYHPNNTYAARIPLRSALAVSRSTAVHWVGFPRPFQKIHPVLAEILRRAPSGRPIPITIDLFESDLGPGSVKVPGPAPFVTTRRGEVVRDPAGPRSWRWKTNGRVAAALVARGVRVVGYLESIDAYEAEADPATIAELVDLDFVAFVEWRPTPEALHDRVVPQVGADYTREVYKTTKVTVGVIDTGFHLANGGYAGHLDLSKAAVGWNYWPGGGCGSPFCDEASQGYHGTHVLGTICGTGVVQAKYRGISPYLGGGGATQRLFLVKGLTTRGFVHMRQPFKDPGGNTTPRPVAVSNSWGIAGCVNRCSAPANWVGSEASARVVDDEVWRYHQLYVFAAGNAGGAGGKTFVPGTIGQEAAAKNALAVGMARDGNRTAPPAGIPGSIVYWSSHGPCGDGRFKPNVSAPGCSTTSTAGGTRNRYKADCGTSMAAPVVTGIMAAVAERYTVLQSNAALARAWAMATAVTWRDASAPGSWGWLPASHLNSHGMGRISALKASNGGGSLPWFRNWVSATIGTAGAYFDVDVFAGVSRLVVVMTWDDPPASAGAKPAAVHDLDLYVDRAPFSGGLNTGEYRSTSTIQTVEHVIVNAPAAGKYRIKIRPWRLTGTVPVGVMVVQLYGDTTPSGTLTVTPDRRYLRPGGSVAATVAVKPSSYLATNTFVLEGSQAGLRRTSSSLTLKDGVVVADPHDPGDGGVHLGDILRNDARKVIYRYQDVARTEGTRTISFRTLSDNMVSLSSSANVVVDGTPPGRVGSLHSTSHRQGVWSNRAKVDYTWVQAPDNLSGIDGYSLSTSLGAASMPDAIKDVGAITSWSHTLSTSSKGYFFAVRAVDRSGNWAPSWSYTGPYLIDTVQPGAASSLRSTTHRTGVWHRNPVVTFAWNAAVDAHSGLDGYGILLSDDRPARPGATKDLGAVTTHRVTLPSASHAWYFNLRSKDRAGNWDDDFVSTGPYWIDAVPPSGVKLVIDLGAGGTVNPAVTLAVAAQDSHSGLDVMRMRNDGGTWSPWVSFSKTRPWNLTDYGGSSRLGTRKVEIEVRDKAGNVARASDTIYLFRAPGYFGKACRGSMGVPVFRITGNIGVGQSMTLSVSNTAASTAALFFGASTTSWAGMKLPLDLAIVGVPGCFVNVALDAEVYSGAAKSFVLPVPNVPAYAGAKLNFQWVLFGDPSGKPVVTTWGATVVLAGP